MEDVPCRKPPVPLLDATSVVMEIGPGHGRWAEFMVGRTARVVLVDISKNCLEYCRRRFADARIETHLSSGHDLPPGLTGRVDFIWSFDAFVHMGRREVGLYLHEMNRVLAPGGYAVIHHANRRHATLWLGFLRRLGPQGIELYRRISLGSRKDDDGWRGNVSAHLFACLAAAAGLIVEKQLVWWQDGFGVPRFNDRVTILFKPIRLIPGAISPTKVPPRLAGGGRGRGRD